MPLPRPPVLAFALLLLPARAESWPSGATIDPAVTADITDEGFVALADLIPALLPSTIPIDAVADEEEGTWGQCWLGGYAYSLTGAWVGIEVTSASITPGSGVLDIRADLLVNVNDAADPFDLYIEAECIGDTCSGYVDPFPVQVQTTMALEVVDDGTGNRVLDATMGGMNVSYSLDGGDIHLDDCAIGTIEQILNFFGLSLYDLILSLVGGYVDDAVADMGPELEEAIEDAFAEASVHEELEVGDGVVVVDLEPSDVEVTTSGARVFLAGSMTADAAACVAAYDPGGSARTESNPPAIGAAPAGVDSDFHVAMNVSDDFANNALYAIWRAGALCYALEPGGDISLDTSILDSMSGGAYAAIFPDPVPLSLVMRPEAPPSVDYGGPHDLDVDVRDLGLDFYGELDGRAARVLSLSLDAQAGVDLALDAGTGELAVAVDLAADDVVPSVAYNEHAAEANDTILASFGGLFDKIVGSVLGGLLEDLAFALPSYNGIGLEDLATGAGGSNGDWLGIFTWIGPVSYTSEGCGSEDGSCGGGCMATPAGPAALVPLGALVLLRRRRRAIT